MTFVISIPEAAWIKKAALAQRRTVSNYLGIMVSAEIKRRSKQ